MARKLGKTLILWFVGAATYYMIEIMWRGYSHISMFILGGLCFLLVGGINEHLPWDMDLLLQSTIGAGLITIAEFVTGCMVNLWLGLGVWDYSGMPFNVLGQACLAFTLAWIPLSAVAIVVDDWLRYKRFGEDVPSYRLMGKKFTLG